MAETLTVLRLDVPPTLARTLRSTNAVWVDDLDLPRTLQNVKRWRDGQMALRWCAAGMVEASKQFRRVKQDEQKAFAKRDLSSVDYMYVWADGIHVNIRLEEHKLCLLVIIGVRADGDGALGFWGGLREVFPDTRDGTFGPGPVQA